MNRKVTRTTAAPWRRVTGRLSLLFGRTPAPPRAPRFDRNTATFEQMEPRVLLSGNGVGNGPPDHAQGPPDAIVAELNAGENAAVQRSIQEFVDAQGTYCIDDGAGGCFLFVPPLDNFFGWSDPAQDLFASVDYAGIADDFAGGIFGTTFSGSVTERPLPDGRAEVKVVLQTKNALTWVIEGLDFENGPLVLGNRVTDVLAGAEPALGDSLLTVTFINTAPGAPLPDLLQVAIEEDPGVGFELLRLGFQSTAEGTFHDQAGFTEGAHGRLKIAEVGIFDSPASPGSAVGMDGFPVEIFRLNETGGGHDNHNVADNSEPEPVVLTAAAAAADKNGAVQRSIAEFVDAQGTYSAPGNPDAPFPQVPPLADFVGWTDVENFLGYSADYGLIAYKDLLSKGIDLGTTFSGSVTERPLPDGTAELDVRLHTRNALTFVIQGNPVTFWDFGDDPLVFGVRSSDVELGATPSLGDSLLTVKLIAPQPGLPLPDLFGVFFGDLGYGVKQVKFQASAHGLLADGTPGRAKTSQAGIFNSHNFPSGHDGFPVERIDVGAIKGAMAQWLAEQNDDDGDEVPALTLIEAE